MSKEDDPTGGTVIEEGDSEKHLREDVAPGISENLTDGDTETAYHLVDQIKAAEELGIVSPGAVEGLHKEVADLTEQSFEEE